MSEPAVVSLINDMNTLMSDMNSKVSTLTTFISKLQSEIQELKSENACNTIEEMKGEMLILLIDIYQMFICDIDITDYVIYIFVFVKL